MAQAALPTLPCSRLSSTRIAFAFAFTSRVRAGWRDDLGFGGMSSGRGVLAVSGWQAVARYGL